MKIIKCELDNDEGKVEALARPASDCVSHPYQMLRTPGSMWTVTISISVRTNLIKYSMLSCAMQ